MKRLGFFTIMLFTLSFAVTAVAQAKSSPCQKEVDALSKCSGCKGNKCKVSANCSKQFNDMLKCAMKHGKKKSS